MDYAKNKVKYPAADLKLIIKYLHDPYNRNFLKIMGGMERFVHLFNKIMRIN